MTNNIIAGLICGGIILYLLICCVVCAIYPPHYPFAEGQIVTIKPFDEKCMVIDMENLNSGCYVLVRMKDGSNKVINSEELE
jgi:hypothetical protein